MAKLELRTEEISKQVAGDAAVCSRGKSGCTGRNIEGIGEAAVSLQIHLDADMVSEVPNECSAASVQTLVLRVGLARCKMHVGVVERELCLWIFLRHCRYSQQQHNSEHK